MYVFIFSVWTKGIHISVVVLSSLSEGIYACLKPREPYVRRSGLKDVWIILAAFAYNC